MNKEMIGRAVELAHRLGHVFVATAADDGTPHVAAAAQLEPASRGRVRVSAWFCPGTVTNLQENRRISLVVWDRERDDGYQLVGSVEEMTDVALMDGYTPHTETAPMPQVERQLLVRVEETLMFTHAPHSDLEGTPVRVASEGA